jgi:hypothetical protein
MKHERLLAAVAVLTTAGLLLSLRLSHATAQEGAVGVAGNHPNIR